MSVAGPEKEKKPEHINIKVNNQEGNEVFFRIKRNTQLKKLMKAYCEQQAVDLYSIRFLLDGKRLNGEQTPDEVGLEDDDEIDAMRNQIGGSLINYA